MSSRTLLSARASAASASLLRISPSLSAGPSSRPAAAAATSLLPPRRTASSSSSSSARPAAEPFQPHRNAAQEAARAQALRQAALDRMARLKLEELARTKRATGRASPAAAPHSTASSSAAAAAAATAGTRTGPAGERSRPAATDEPDRPHPTVERLKRERERKRQQKAAAAAAAAEAEAEILHEKPVDRAPFQRIRDWYFALGPKGRFIYGGGLLVFAAVGLLFFDPLTNGGGGPTTRSYGQDTDWMRAELVRLELEEKERRRLARGAGGGGGRIA